ncbi:hypothetical protein SCUCBS95973_002482 [Sporothrix curviconia]|uniref:Methyltransferase domain-containing protein n=1 Tax=Sporothrix curviconia TaxID=1260050 RepID=A0ABP0B7H9_9PEZI
MVAGRLNVHLQEGAAEASSLTIQEHGRHFLVNSAQYLFPWDSVEAHRMDLFHKAVTLICSHGPSSSGLHSAPLRLSHHLHILDLGTGTGLWVVEMAEIPSNAKFQSLDIETHWQLGTASWDLIHIRCLNGVVRNWPSLYATVHDHLIPDVGHIEHLEMDWTPLDGAGPHLTNWSRTLFSCMDSTGRSLRVDSDETAKALEEAGFIDVRTTRYYLPFARMPSKRQSPRQTASFSTAFSTTSGTSLPSISGMSSPAGSNNYYDEEDNSNSDNDNNNSSKMAGAEVWFPRAFEQWLEGLTLMPMLRAGYSLEAIYRLLADVRQELEDPAVQAKCTM